MNKQFHSFIKSFSLILLFLLTGSCKSQNVMKTEGILEGTTGLFEGNCMPGPGVPPCEAKPISTTIYITSPSKDFSMELLKDSVVSNDKGLFNMNLLPGKYSLFVRDGSEIICTIQECDPDCFCLPITIVADSVIVQNINLDHATW